MHRGRSVALLLLLLLLVRRLRKSLVGRRRILLVGLVRRGRLLVLRLGKSASSAKLLLGRGRAAVSGIPTSLRRSTVSSFSVAARGKRRDQFDASVSLTRRAPSL